jgi:hypothetical protein
MNVQAQRVVFDSDPQPIEVLLTPPVLELSAKLCFVEVRNSESIHKVTDYAREGPHRSPPVVASSPFIISRASESKRRPNG